METFESRDKDYILANYAIPADMEFCIDGLETDFDTWVSEYIEDVNVNVDSPYTNESDDYDVYMIGDNLLEIMSGERHGERFTIY